MQVGNENVILAFKGSAKQRVT